MNDLLVLFCSSLLGSLLEFLFWFFYTQLKTKLKPKLIDRWIEMEAAETPRLSTIPLPEGWSDSSDGDGIQEV